MPVSNTTQSLSFPLSQSKRSGQTEDVERGGHDVSHACSVLDIGLLPRIGNVDV
jgi:hypothetical protein